MWWSCWYSGTVKKLQWQKATYKMNYYYMLHTFLLITLSYQDIIYNVACKTPYTVKAWCIIFNELDGYIRKLEKTSIISIWKIW